MDTFNINNKKIYTISSYIPGRIRLKTRYIYKNKILADYLKTNIKKITGIIKININIHSKSILIHYNHDVKISVIIKKIFSLINKFNKKFQKIASTSESNNGNKNSKTKNGKIIEIIKNENKTKWYMLGSNQIQKKLRTDINQGLTEKEAKLRLKNKGLNKLKDQEQKSLIKIIISQFDNYLIKLLSGASLVFIYMGHTIDAITIIAIVIIEVAMGVWQNYKTEKELKALKEYSAAKTPVKRNGKIHNVKSKYLVPGDIIQLEAGNIVPADARIVSSSNLKLNESQLTGESSSVFKSHKVRYTTQIPLADRKNMIYMGTTVVKGSCKAVVVRTGLNTRMGNISDIVSEAEDEKTPLQKDIKKLAKAITFGCIGAAGMIIISGIIGGQSFMQMLTTGVSVAIGAVPEGLTGILTISLAFGVERMVSKGAIVKQLPSMEAISCIDVICTDKTGTLTTGEMTVTKIYTFDREFEITGKGYSTQGDFLCAGEKIEPIKNNSLKKVVTLGKLCNNADL